MSASDRVDYTDGHLQVVRHGTTYFLPVTDIVRIDVCHMADPLSHGDETFHMVHGRDNYWLIGPFIAGACGALRALLAEHPATPVREVAVVSLPWRMREPGFLRLRLFPIAGLRRFASNDLPPLDAGRQARLS